MCLFYRAGQALNELLLGKHLEQSLAWLSSPSRQDPVKFASWLSLASDTLAPVTERVSSWSLASALSTPTPHPDSVFGGPRGRDP